MLQDRYGSVGGQVKVAVRVGMVPGLFEPGEGEQNAESMSSAS
jgi:hypothetical protein